MDLSEMTPAERAEAMRALIVRATEKITRDLADQRDLNSLGLIAMVLKDIAERLQTRPDGRDLNINLNKRGGGGGSRKITPYLDPLELNRGLY